VKEREKVIDERGLVNEKEKLGYVMNG